MAVYHPPPREAFTRRELAVIDGHRTPAAVQRFLNFGLRYNHHLVGTRLASFREVLRSGQTMCIEAALVAAVILEQHGYPPLVVSLESQDDLDHVLFVFRHRGRWGAVARSRDAGLHGRRPVYRSIRDLVWSYYDPYVDWTGRLTGYALIDLRTVAPYDWRFNRRNMWWLERYMVRFPHTPLRSSDARYRSLLARYRVFRARHPHAPVDYYPTRRYWMWPGRRRWHQSQGSITSPDGCRPVPAAGPPATARPRRDGGA
ncbi:MAG: hypothetical protein QN120_04840 [Armatimonadota bacterium]|nr:hypothetical protein [Armatimonadota bacterium]